MRVIQEGKIAGAALDVYALEPLSLDHPLRKCGDRVTLSPHNGYVSDENYKVCAWFYYRNHCDYHSLLLRGATGILDPDSG